ncbi:MAG: bifunctional oligoribonuclease/PAP phosphatase NrnA [Gemmatimonadota bacterium]
MTYQIPPSRRRDIDALIPLIQGSRRVILTTHLNADGDGTGCEAALLAILSEMGKEAWIINPTPFPEPFLFLLSDPERVVAAGTAHAEALCREADLGIVVDTGEKSRIGRVKPMLDPLPLIVIDHHPPGEDALEATSLRDPTAAAAGELVFDLIHAMGGPWSRSVVEGLYVAILTDTGSFRFSNATPSVHRVVAELIERGASPDGLYRSVYGQVPLRRIQLLQESLATLTLSPDGSVAWMTVPATTFRTLGCTSEDLDGMVDYPRGLEGVEVGLLFRELETGQVKASFRSNGAVDVNKVARVFGGGGHVRASGALMRGTLEEVRQRVVDEVLAEINTSASPVGEP